MTLRQFINSGLLDAFAEFINDAVGVDILLTSVGMPQHLRPATPSNDAGWYNFWMAVGRTIESGRLGVGGNLQALANAARNRFPGNDQIRNACEAAIANSGEHGVKPEVFNSAATPQPAPPVEFPRDESQHDSTATTDETSPTGSGNRQSEFVFLTVTGWNSISSLVAAATSFAEAHGLNPGGINFAYSSAEGSTIELTDWTPDAASELGQTLTQQAPVGGESHFSVTSSRFRDYLLSRLFVEGPDQQRFEFNDVPATTLVRDVAEDLIRAEYTDPKMQASGIGLGNREVVVDLEKPDGSTQRLDPDKSLHDHGIRDGDTVSVSPESTAGNVHPVIREMALARVRNEVLDFAESHPGFEVLANSPFAPTEYEFHFQAPSFAPNPTGGEPLLIDKHQVKLILPAAFPMAAPDVFWLTPIFHPNINQKEHGYGYVCLGPLKDGYRPAMNFGDLCQWLIDLASYRNYAVQEGHNLEAQHWAARPEGQIAIEQRGGKSLIRMMLHSVRTPRKLWIKRAD